MIQQLIINGIIAGSIYALPLAAAVSPIVEGHMNDKVDLEK